MKNEVLVQVRKTLNDNIDEKTLRTGTRVFKEEVKLIGVKVPVVNRVSKELFTKIEDEPKAAIFELCEELWKSGYSEESYVACSWSYYISERYEPSDIDVFDRWVNRYVSNWASCDTLCNHSVGTLIEMYPQLVNRLKTWAMSSNRWVKRAAAVTLIIPARKGLFLEAIFEIANTLLLDKDDLVQKGYGWMLKAASEAHQQEVFDYVMANKAVMPRTALRYAIEKMPEALKAIAMAR